MNRRLVRADQLQMGDAFHPPGWTDRYIDGCKVTAVTKPFHPHIRAATRTVHFPERMCVRVQLDELSWILLDTDHQIELL